MSLMLTRLYDLVFLPKESLVDAQSRKIDVLFYAVFLALVFSFMKPSFDWFVIRFIALFGVFFSVYFFYILCLDALAQFLGASSQLRHISAWWLFSFSPFLLLPGLSGFMGFFNVSTLLFIGMFLYSLWYQSILLNRFYGFGIGKSLLTLVLSFNIMLWGSFLVWLAFILYVGPGFFSSLSL